jgi:carbamoyl-phosphate synthase small subunit
LRLRETRVYLLRHKRPHCRLALEDGRVFEGRSVGAEGSAEGEVVFNTGMTGYQEILTDPSYAGQIVTMTSPLIGNYGTNDEDPESAKPHVEGFIVRESSRLPSNWRSGKSLPELLAEAGVVAADNIDTRALTLHIREKGAMRAVISTDGASESDLVDRAKASPPMEGRDLANVVTTPEAYDWSDAPAVAEGARELAVIVYDFGVKRSILRGLAAAGFRVRVVPASTPASEVLAAKPDGVFFSNGPGDPAPVEAGIAAAREIVGKVPVFGICLGHQIMGLALGGRTYKLKFGHHGSNHPVKDLTTERIEITAQNHGFCVDAESLTDREVSVTHVNLNDKTVEGLSLPGERASSVQFHPEAGPGPHDARGLFRRFADAIHGGKS